VCRDSTGNFKDGIIEGEELDTDNLINTLKNINNTLQEYIDKNKKKNDETSGEIKSTTKNIKVDKTFSAKMSVIVPV
jgi:hypothetical protein